MSENLSRRDFLKIAAMAGAAVATATYGGTVKPMSTQIELPRTTPESQGIASAALLEFIEALENQVDEVHSLMLLRHGNVVAEGWWSPYAPAYPHLLFSLSKSFAATAVGLAVAEGYFSLNDPVLSFFPDVTPAEANGFLSRMQIRHLLSMSTGHADDTFPPMFERSDSIWTNAFFEVPVQHEPGTHFLYNTGATYMLSAIVQQTTGMKVVDYLQPRLFDPLGIEHPTWQESPQGINLGGTGLSLKTEDIARFGQLYLQKGRWQDQQILPEAWVEAATTAQVSNGNDPASDWTQGYGYQFWRSRYGNYRGDGAFGQYCVVMPAHDVVLALTSGTGDLQQPLNIIWDMLLPALRPNALPEDAAAHAALTQKLSNLNMPPVDGQDSSPVAAQVSGQTYRVEANERNIEAITLNFAGPDQHMIVKTAAAEETIPFGYGAWQPGQTRLFNDRWTVGENRTATSGAWTADNIFTLIVRLNETPFYHTLNLQFVHDELRVESRVNVDFVPVEPVILEAHQVQ